MFVPVHRADKHNHPPDDFAARRGIVLKRIHQKIHSNPTEPVKRAFDAVIQSDSGESDDLPQFHNVRSRVKRIRADLMQRLSQSVNDVDISGEWKKKHGNRARS